MGFGIWGVGRWLLVACCLLLDQAGQSPRRNINETQAGTLGRAEWLSHSRKASLYRSGGTALPSLPPPPPPHIVVTACNSDLRQLHLLGSSSCPLHISPVCLPNSCQLSCNLESSSFSNPFLTSASPASIPTCVSV